MCLALVGDVTISCGECMSHLSCIPQLVSDCHDVLHSVVICRVCVCVVMLHAPCGAVWCTSATVHIHCCCGVSGGVLCGVYRFFQFGDSGYVTDFSYHLASRFYEAYSVHT